MVKVMEDGDKCSECNKIVHSSTEINNKIVCVECYLKNHAEKDWKAYHFKHTHEGD